MNTLQIDVAVIIEEGLRTALLDLHTKLSVKLRAAQAHVSKAA